MKINWADHQELLEELGLDDAKKEKVNKLVQSYTDKVRTEYSKRVKGLERQIAELEQYKLKELTEQEKQLKQKEKELFAKEKNLILKEKGLAEFGEFFDVEKIDDLEDRINKFTEILKQKKVDNSYKPEEKHKQTDKYSQAKQKGDAISMIKALF